ncbi:unnamed protein product [Cercospora beticola]|nr:unnamed protein product [Cercospora beticola]
MTESKKAPYKWIAAKIESLDPYKNYEEIVRLTTCYQANDFMNNLIYSITFPQLMKPEWAARAIWREDGGKVLHKATVRCEDSEYHNMTWLFYGPSDKRCLDSIAYVNNLHARLEAKVTPGCYGHNDDYVYTLASAALIGQRFATTLGLPRLTTKQKIATHLFWQEMSKHFESHHPGVWEQFAFRFFPPGLRWLGRVTVVSLSNPQHIRDVGATDVHPLTRMVVLWILSWVFWLLLFAPDPPPGEVPFEKQQALSKEEKKLRLKGFVEEDKKFCPYFAKAYMNKRPDCPYYVKLKEEL